MTLLVVPLALWERMLDEFRAVPFEVERVAYLDGYRLADIGIVTTLTIPRAELAPGYFRVPADAMSAAGQHLRLFEMSRLAQVHTHPSGETGHSPTDDQLAYSQRRGSLSIVLPHHAARRPSIAEGALHVRGELGWRRLNAAEAAEQVLIVPSFVHQGHWKWHESLVDTRVTWADSSLRSVRAALQMWWSRFRQSWRG